MIQRLCNPFSNSGSIDAAPASRVFRLSDSVPGKTRRLMAFIKHSRSKKPRVVLCADCHMVGGEALSHMLPGGPQDGKR